MNFTTERVNAEEPGIAGAGLCLRVSEGNYSSEEAPTVVRCCLMTGISVTGGDREGRLSGGLPNGSPQRAPTNVGEELSIP